MTTIAPPAVDAWKTQPRAMDGTWGERPLPAPPTIERPEYNVIRSKGRMTILGHKFVIKFDSRKNLYHYDKSAMAAHLLGPEYRRAVERADFLVDRLNDGTFDIHGLSAAVGLLKAFNRDAQNNENSRLRLPASIPAEINPSAVIVRWMTADERSPAQWSRAVDVLFGSGDGSDCLKVNVETGDHSPWDQSDIELEAIADCVDMLTERVETARGRSVGPPTTTSWEAWAQSVAALPPFKFLRAAVKRLAVDDYSLLSPDRASRWLGGIIGPCPYHPQMLEDRSVADALEVLMRRALDSPDSLVEFLGHVRDNNESYGTAVAKAILLRTLRHEHCSPEALNIAWDIVLQGDSPDVMRQVASLHGVSPWELGPDAAEFLPQERSSDLREHLQKISLQGVLEDYRQQASYAGVEPYLSPNVRERVERADEALRRYRRELADMLPGGLSSLSAS